MALPTITIYIEASAAVRACSNVCGATPMRLTAEDRASLTPEQRDTLARHFDGEPGPFADGPHWGDPIWQCIRVEDLARHGIVGDAALPSRWPAFADLPTLRIMLDVRRRVIHDAMARADLDVYAVKVREDMWTAPISALASRTMYLGAKDRGLAVIVNRIDGVCVAHHMRAGESIDVPAQKIWHRVAAGALARLHADANDRKVQP
jgi:hypothetical protein